MQKVEKNEKGEKKRRIMIRSDSRFGEIAQSTMQGIKFLKIRSGRAGVVTTDPPDPSEKGTGQDNKRG
jgi:hypothetical protein